jgi:hypothetical protein
MCAKGRPRGGTVCEILRIGSETEEMGGRWRIMLIERATPPLCLTSTGGERGIYVLLCLRHYYIIFAVHKGIPSMCCVAVGKEFSHGYSQAS